MEDEQIDNKKKFYQELYQFLRNNWGKILFLGIILTLYGLSYIPGFGLFKSIFGFFNAVATTLQSLLVGSPGNCINKKPICGANKEFSGSTCCPCANNDATKSNMTCDNDNTVCCGCGNGCPMNKSMIQQLVGSKKILLWVGLAFGGFVLLGLIKAFGNGKLLTGRTPQQSAMLMSTAADAENSVKNGVLSQAMATDKVSLKEAETKSPSPEQRNQIDLANRSIEEYASAKEAAIVADGNLRENPTDPSLRDDAARKNADAQEKEAIAQERIKEVSGLR